MVRRVTVRAFAVAAMLMLLAAVILAAGTLSSVIIGFKEDSTQAARDKIKRDIIQSGGSITAEFEFISALAAKVPDGFLTYLRSNPAIKYIEPDATVTVMPQPTPSATSTSVSSWSSWSSAPTAAPTAAESQTSRLLSSPSAASASASGSSLSSNDVPRMP